MTNNALELYDLAEQNDIIIINGKLNKAPAISICDNGDCAIIIDDKQIESQSDEVTKLAHELGHCETGAFYDENTLETRSRCEYKADKWAIQKLMPKEEVQKAFEQGYVEVWQLAEYFNVNEDLVRKAMWIYFDKVV